MCIHMIEGKQCYIRENATFMIQERKFSVPSYGKS